MEQYWSWIIGIDVTLLVLLVLIVINNKRRYDVWEREYKAALRECINLFDEDTAIELYRDSHTPKEAAAATLDLIQGAEVPAFLRKQGS
jgi:hypothetical protein